MVQLQNDTQKLQDANIQVVGISYDDVSILEKFANKEGITFPLLSDADSQTIHEYGVHNKDGLPHPGTVVIDQRGIVRGKIFRDGYRERHPTEELVELATSLSL